MGKKSPAGAEGGTDANPLLDEIVTQPPRFRPVSGGNAPDPACPPLVSLVTPCHNTGPVMIETAACVQAQTVPAWEWILVDDGSDDPGTLATLDEIERLADPRISVVRLPVNQGVSAARNTGIHRSNARFVAFLDSDDLIEAEALEIWLAHLEGNPKASFVNSWVVGFGAEQYLWQQGFERPHEFLHQNLANPTGLYRRELFETIGGFDEKIRDGLEDWEFWWRCLDRNQWGLTVRDFLIWYRRRECHGDKWRNWDAGEMRQSFLNDILRARYPGVARMDQFPDVATPADGLAPLRPLALPEFRAATGSRRHLLLLLPHAEVGGSDKFNFDLIRCLGDKGYAFTAVTTGKDPGAWFTRLRRASDAAFSVHAFLDASAIPAFIGHLIASRGVDGILISHSVLGYQLTPWLATNHSDVPVFDYVHIEMDDWRSGGYPRYSIIYQQWLNATIASSDHLKSWMGGRGGPSDRIRVHRIHVDLDFWNPGQADAARARAALSLDDGIPLIMSAFRFTDQKRPGLLIEILARLAARGARFQAIVSGDGDLFGETRARADSLGLMDSMLRLPGMLPQEDVRDLMAAADIFLLPSDNEGIAATLYECMAMECVPVASDVGGQGEIVTPETGFLIPKTDREIDHYVEILESLIEDTERRRSIAVAARSGIQAFSLDELARSMDSTLRDATLRGRHRSRLDKSVADLMAIEALEQSRIEIWGRTLSGEVKKKSRQADERKVRIQRLERKIADLKAMVSRRDRALDKIRSKRCGLINLKAPFGLTMKRRSK